MDNITNGILEDVRGAAHTVVHEGKIVVIPQLGHALSLDGIDDWVDTGEYTESESVSTDILSVTPPGERHSMRSKVADLFLWKG